MNNIVEFKEYYTVYFKGGETMQLSVEAGQLLKQKLLTNNSDFYEIGGVVYNKYQIKQVEPSKVVNNIDAYILAQPKPVRDAINRYAKENNIRWNSIEHVSNFVNSYEEKQKISG